MATQLTSDYFGTISSGTFQNDYTFIETVGKGGYGEVYKVVSKKDFHTYAVKKIRIDKHRQKENLNFIKRELINNAKLSHENIVRYYDSWVELSDDQHSGGYGLSGDRESSSESDITEKLPNAASFDECHGSCEPWAMQEASISHEDFTEEDVIDDEEFTPQTTNSNLNQNTICDLGCTTGSNVCTLYSEPFSDTLIDYKLNEPGPSEKLDKSCLDPDIDIVFTDDTDIEVKDLGNSSYCLRFEYIEDMCMEQQSAHNHVNELPFTDFSQFILGTGSSSDLFKGESHCFMPSEDNESPMALNLYIKMELCESTLRQAIDNGMFIENDELCWNYLRQIVTGLNYIHSKGIIHRDLKPNNIFITNENLVKIGDFGLSRWQPGSDLHNGADGTNNIRQVDDLTGGRGTFWYSAPEMLHASNCNYGQEVDMFSLGLIFFEMCYEIMKTSQEKAMIFERLRKERKFPDNFDRNAKAKHAQIIETLLAPNPKERTTLREILHLIDGGDNARLLTQAETLIGHIVDTQCNELYRSLIEKLFDRKTGHCVPIYQSCTSSEQTLATKLAFINVVKSHGAKDICLPLFLPIPDTENSRSGDETVLIDAEGNPVYITDSALRSFIHTLEKRKISPMGAFYYAQTMSLVHDICEEKRSVSSPELWYFSFSASDDMLSIAKSLLILQKTLTKMGHCTADFEICITHTDLENGLIAFYNLGETDKGVLCRINDLVVGRNARKRVLKRVNESGMSIPEILVMSGGYKMMIEKLKKILGNLQRPLRGTETHDFEKLHNVLDFLTHLKEVIDAIGVTIDTKLELLMTDQNGISKESGIKFRLRKRHTLTIVAKGGQSETDMNLDSDVTENQFIWVQLDPLQLEDDTETLSAPDVTIVYDKTNPEEVKGTSYLCGQLTNLGLTVTEIELKREFSGAISISPHCKFLVNFVSSVLEERDTKLQKIPVNIQTIVNHIKQRRHFHCMKYTLNYRIHYHKARIIRILIYRVRLTNHSSQ